MSRSPVVVPEFDVSPWLQNLPVLQPCELGQGLTLGQAGKDSRGAHRSGNGLRRLDKLGGGWGEHRRGGQASLSCSRPNPSLGISNHTLLELQIVFCSQLSRIGNLFPPNPCQKLIT